MSDFQLGMIVGWVLGCFVGVNIYSAIRKLKSTSINNHHKVCIEKALHHSSKDV